MPKSLDLREASEHKRIIVVSGFREIYMPDSYCFLAEIQQMK